MLLTAALLLIMPPEQKLGHVIKAVYIHAALVQTGLLVFFAAGIFGLFYLFSKSEKQRTAMTASQKTGVVIWSLYAASSMIVTRLAWGVWVAWEEPRVRSSALIWAAVLLFFVLARWVHDARFTAIVNILLACLSWWLTKTAGMVRHPLDPIADSNSLLLKLFFLLIFALTILIAIQLTRLISKEQGW